MGAGNGNASQTLDSIGEFRAPLTLPCRRSKTANTVSYTRTGPSTHAHDCSCAHSRANPCSFSPTHADAESFSATHSNADSNARTIAYAARSNSPNYSDAATCHAKATAHATAADTNARPCDGCTDHAFNSATCSGRSAAAKR